MKKYLSLALVILAIITACICLVSCKNDETPLEVVLEEIDKITFKDKTVSYNGKPKNITVTTRLRYNRLPAGIKVRYEGNGNINVGEYEVKAIFSRNGVEIPEATKTAKLTIKQGTYDISESLESFKDTTVFYNGQAQTLKVNERYLPEGVSVTYVHSAEPKAAGEYQITAKFSHTNENYMSIPDQTVTLTVERKVLDTAGITFNRTFTIFDGTIKSVKVNGELPEGLLVRYEGNDVISVGSHKVRAVFYTKDPNCEKEGCENNPYCCEDPNYQAPEPMETTLVVLNESYSSTEDLTFTENADGTGYTITGYNGSATYLIIPDTYSGKPVTEIAKNAFYDKDKTFNFIYAYIPDTVKTIGDYAFRDCTKLKEIYLSPSLEKLDGRVFLGCSLLEEIVIPDKVTEIPSRCFEGCESLTSVTLGSAVTSIGSGAFKNCVKLEKIFIPKSLTEIVAARAANSPFVGTNENLMIVLESTAPGANFSEHWSVISSSTGARAFVLYGQSYENFITKYDELKNADKTNSLLSEIVIGATPLDGFDSNTLTYEAYANIHYGYPTVSAKAVSPAALVTIVQATVANGGVATVTVTSANGTVKTYTINFNLIGKFTASAEVVNKNGADGVVTYVIDDGYEPTATYAKSMLQNHSYLSLSFAIQTDHFATLTDQTDPDGKKSYVMNEGEYTYTVNQNKVNFWNNILLGVEGRAEITVHSHTHATWGINDDGGQYMYVKNDGSMYQRTAHKGSTSKELYASKQIISKLFPEMKNVGFVEPGIGAMTTDFVKDGVTYPTYHTYFKQKLEECINNNVYLGSRGTFQVGADYASRIVTKDTINDMSVRMNLPGLMVKESDSVKAWTDYIDLAAEMGGWAMFCIHAIEVPGTSQGNWVISQSKANELLTYTADKNIWVATYSDALTYFIEWATAEVDAQYDSANERIAVTLTDGEDDSKIFNTPLTVKVTVPVMWESVKCGNQNLDVHVNYDGSKFVYVDVVPDTATIYLEMAAE